MEQNIIEITLKHNKKTSTKKYNCDTISTDDFERLISDMEQEVLSN